MFKKITVIFIFIVFFFLLLTTCAAEVNNSDNSTLNSVSKDNINKYSFKSLNELIQNANKTLTLSGNYKYDKNIDSKFKNGILITKDITIKGKGSCSIDGSNLARCLKINTHVKVVLQNIVIKNGYSTGNGAGILMLKNSKLTVKKCVFQSNRVYNANGAGIASDKGCYIEIHSSKFINNQAVRHSNLKWEDYKKGMGSAIMTYIGNTLKIYDSTFKGNKAYLSTILVISYVETDYKLSKAYIKNCVFEKNPSKRNGAVYIDELGKATILKCKFLNNPSTKGAALVLDTSRGSIVKDCLFYKNTGNNGGAIHVNVYDFSYNSHVKIVHCRFIKNTALRYGGAIYSIKGIVTVLDSNFNSNKANGWGGAIYTRLGSLSVNKIKAEKNKASYGAAIYLTSQKASVKKSSFVKNSAYYEYGSIYTNLIHIKYKNCYFKSNKALKYSKISFYKSGNKIKVLIKDYKGKTIKKKFKIKFTGKSKHTTKWYKSKKTTKSVKIPSKLKHGTYNVGVIVKNARYLTKNIKINI